MAGGVRLALALLLVAPAAAAQTIVLRTGGAERSLALETLPRATLSVRDPTDGGRQKILTGARLSSALAGQPVPEGADTLAVRCNDGWLSLIARKALASYPEALLAVGQRVAGGGTAPLDEPRGPVFLAWPNLDHPELDLDQELSPGGWSFAVASLEYVRRVDFTRPLELPPEAPPVAQRGARLCAKHCQHCHAINGAGGRAGWDLNQPNVLTYRTEAYVRDYILDPRRRNPYGHMEPFRGKLKPAEVAALLAYLKALGH